MNLHSLAVELIPINAPNPEDVLIAPDGTLLTGTDDGRILHVTADGIMTVADTGGRPLGLDWMLDGRILVCDTRKGLMAVDQRTGVIEMLVPAGGDVSLSLCNNPCMAPDGRIFFSDSTQRYEVEAARTDVVENVGTGRLLSRHPDGRVEVLLDGLLFANGVLLAPDQSFVLVAETGKGCVHRLWLEGGKKGERDLFVDDLPCLPDNLSLGSDGLVWLALVDERIDTLNLLHNAPYWVRYLLARLPVWMLPQPTAICRAMAFDWDGNTIHNLSGEPDKINRVTGVREHNGTLYMGSINSNAIGKMRIY